METSPTASTAPAGDITQPSPAEGQLKVEAAEETPERPAKKSRTNKPWTPTEEKRLKAMRDDNKTWSEIAKVYQCCSYLKGRGS